MCVYLHIRYVLHSLPETLMLKPEHQEYEFDRKCVSIKQHQGQR